MSALGEQVVDLELLWGGVMTQRLRERLHSAPTPEQALSTLESVLTSRYVREETAADIGLQRVHHATWWMRRRPAPAIRAVSDQLGCSHKHLIAAFHRYVGLAPQRFLQITRFGEVLDALSLVGAGKGQPAVDLADLALSCDYYDQSHFNRDFKRFSGLTPQEYLRRRARVFDVDAAATPQFVPAGATAGDITAAQ